MLPPLSAPPQHSHSDSQTDTNHRHTQTIDTHTQTHPRSGTRLPVPATADMDPNTTILRVKRKRGTDPADALLLACKRIRPETTQSPPGETVPEPEAEVENSVFKLVATVATQVRASDGMRETERMREMERQTWREMGGPRGYRHGAKLS